MGRTIETNPTNVLCLIYRCVERLENTALLREWGKAKTRNDLVVDGPELLHQLNPDILFPLAKTYNELLEGNFSRLVSGITFRQETNRRLAEGAELAAKLMYDSAK